MAGITGGVALLTGLLVLAGVGLMVVLLLVMGVSAMVGAMKEVSTSGWNYGSLMEVERHVESEPEFGDEYVAVVNVHGVIGSTAGLDGANSRRLVRELQAAIDDKNIKAVVLDMNTPGGEVVASDEVHRMVLSCRDAGKPVVTCMRSMGASGGYFIAAGSDWIIANRMTFTGSIGVIMSTLQYSALLDRLGVSIEVYRSGEMKDMLNAARPRTEKEREYVQKLVDGSFREFCQIVADGRKAYATAEDVKASPFGDGRVLDGAAAMELGLVDQLGYYDEAIDKARELCHCPWAGVVRLSRGEKWYDLLFAKFGRAPEVRIQGLSPAMPVGPGLYYLAPELAGGQM